MPDATPTEVENAIAWAKELAARDYAARLRALHGELGLVADDTLSEGQRERVGIVLHELEALANEMEGDSDAPR